MGFSFRALRLGAVCAALLLLLAPLAAAGGTPPALSSPPLPASPPRAAGIPAQGDSAAVATSTWHLLAWPLLVYDTTLDGTLGPQLHGTGSPDTADRVFVWNGVTQSYDMAWFCIGSESDCASLANHWLTENNSLSTLTLPPDAGFWIENRSGAVEALSIAGEVADGDRTVPVGAGWQLLGSAIPIARGLDDAGLPATGGDSPATADRVLYWDSSTQTYRSAWYCGGSVCESWDEPWANHWLAEDYSPTDIVLEPGHGFWYLNRGAPFNWVNRR